VTSIPKPRKANYTEAKAHHPISLSPSILKTWKNWWRGIIGTRFWGYIPYINTNLPTNQKSTETALHHVITHIQEAVENTEVTLGTFLDIEGTFDSTSFDIITKAAKWNGLGDTTCCQIGSFLGSRKITATLAGETLEVSVARGCLQWSLLQHLLYSLVVDELTGGLSGNGYYTLGYAHDIAILIHGKFPNSISSLLQEA
jgi:hypothetical protein